MKIVIFDLDGTLALIGHRRPLVERPDPNWTAFYRACPEDLPNAPVIAAFAAFSRASYTCEIWSGRSDEVRKLTVDWLWKHDLGGYHRLRMRAAGDYTPDEQLKKQWLDEVGASNILCVFDDRDKVVNMWRTNGVTCFQVAPGAF